MRHDAFRATGHDHYIRTPQPALADGVVARGENPRLQCRASHLGVVSREHIGCNRIQLGDDGGCHHRVRSRAVESYDADIQFGALVMHRSGKSRRTRYRRRIAQLDIGELNHCQCGSCASALLCRNHLVHVFDPTAQADFGDGIIGHARHYGNHVLRIRRSAVGECANVDLSTTPS